MIGSIVGLVAIYFAIALTGAFAGSLAEYISVERNLPTLHAGAGFIAGAVGGILAVPGDWLIVHVLGGRGSLVVSVIAFSFAAAIAQQTWFTTGYAYSRELKMEYGDEWANHIGEEVGP